MYREISSGCCLVLVAIFITIAFAQDDPNGLADYAEQDLLKLDEAQLTLFQRRVDAVAGKRQLADGSVPYRPWWIRRFAASGSTWVYLEGYTVPEDPSFHSVRLHLFDKDWRVLTAGCVSMGPFARIIDVNISRSNPLSQDLIEVKLSLPGIDGDDYKDIDEQDRPPKFWMVYITFIGNRIAIVRNEDDTRSIDPVYCGHTNPVPGTVIPKRDASEWIATLTGNAPSEQLATMVWLSGKHLRSDVERRFESEESVENSMTFEVVRASKKTKDALFRLATSKNKWVRDYAKYILKSSRDEE